jgi:hypothetical protein
MDFNLKFKLINGCGTKYYLPLCEKSHKFRDLIYGAKYFECLTQRHLDELAGLGYVSEIEK